MAFISCESLEQDEYKITGSVNGDTFDGKEIYIEKRGDGGLVAVDTAKIESGKFEFKGKVEEPTIHFISIEGMPMQKANFFLEHGNIKLEVDKDTLYKTVSSGTYNNDMLQEYYTKSKVNTDKMRKFKTKNQEIIRNATMSGDTATYNKLEKEGKLLQEAKTKTDMDFIRENPKAHINLYIFGDLLGNSDLEVAKLRKLFDAIDPVVKNTEDGKQIAEYFTMMEAQEKAKENVSAGKKAPD
ncbi:MAG: DUF4369 domain-containing protein, partial [Campylobacterales bacterium]|nr:DUF4369 domain-containing protein [Campylobacterales bacterium]